MRRVLLTLAGLVVALVVLAGLAAWLSYGATPTRSGSVDVPELAAPVALSWNDDGGVVIEAETEAGLAAGLGYAHAADHAWTISLWRRAARGTLSQWFGAQHRESDRFARLLGLDELARATYDALPPAQRGALDAYALGVNAALGDPAVAQNDAFVLLDVTPEPWEPWDALAVERLVSYLATPAPGADSLWSAVAARDSSVADYIRLDSTFRSLVGVSGTAHSRAFAIESGGKTAFVSHLSAGTSSLPFLMGAVLRRGGTSTAVASIPGTLSMPTGLGDGLAWSVLLTAPLTLEPLAGAPPYPVYSRIVDRDGGETLMTVPRDSAGLAVGVGQAAAAMPLPDSLVASDATSAIFQAPEGAPDGLLDATPGTAPDAPAGVSLAARSTAAALADTTRALPDAWRVRWPGFSLGTDLVAFFSLTRGVIPSAFVLLRGDGVAVTDGALRVLGDPPAGAFGTDFVFAAGLRASRLAIPRLQKLAADSAAYSPHTLADDDRSEWAARTAVPLLRALGDRDSLDLSTRLPYSYLRSWTGTYEPTSIGATLLETWLATHRAYAGRLPDPADSLDALLLPRTLRIARAELRDTLDAVATGWEWARIQAPSAAPMLTDALGGGPGGRYRPRTDAPGGHPTALFPGPSLAFETEPVGPIVWSVWADARTADVLTLRPPGVRRVPLRADDLDAPRLIRLDRRATPSGERALRLVPA